MADLAHNIGLEDQFDLSLTDAVFNKQSDTIHHDSVNRSSESNDYSSDISTNTMRFLFIAIATVTILICLTICIAVCICVCLNRRRRSKRLEKTDHRLLPESLETTSSKRISLKHSLPKTLNSNGKEFSDKKSFSSSIQQSSLNVITEKTSIIKPYYYDNLDDIPFIDESRPTSYIDITRV